MWDVDTTLVEQWLLSLPTEDYELCVAALELLQEHGPALGRPLVDHIKGSKIRNLKELRPGSTGKTEYRLLFAFDPQRSAILLVAGNKSGKWRTWYEKMIPLAEKRYMHHLERMRSGENGKA